MKGTALQQLTMNGLTVPNLQINNPANVALGRVARIGNQLNLVNGKLQTGGYSLFLESAASVIGAGAGKFIETNGTGQVRKVVTSNLTNYILPVGNGSNYTPIALTTSGSYASAEVSAASKGTVHPNKPATVPNYLNTYWTVARTGITGTVSGVGTYLTANVIGNEALLRGYFWTGSSWTTTGTTINTTTNQVTSPVAGSGGDVYAMSTIPGTAAIASPFSLDEQAVNNTLSLTIFPNPAHVNTLLSATVPADLTARISLVDVNGRVIPVNTVRLHGGLNQLTIDLSGLTNGVYEVHLKSEHWQKILKLIKY
jgi:hypothetical protein